MRDGNPEVLLRLEHLFDVAEHPIWSQNIDLTLSSLFSDPAFFTGEAEEMALGGNVELSSLERLHWDAGEYAGHIENTHPMDRAFDGENVELRPQEIRTFMLNYQGPATTTTTTTTATPEVDSGDSDGDSDNAGSSSTMSTMSTSTEEEEDDDDDSALVRGASATLVAVAFAIVMF